MLHRWTQAPSLRRDSLPDMNAAIRIYPHDQPRALPTRAQAAATKKLQCHSAAELCILGFLDNTHPALTELFEDSVVRNCLADHVNKPLRRSADIIIGVTASVSNEWSFEVGNASHKATRRIEGGEHSRVQSQ